MRDDGDDVEVMFESDDRLLLREMTHRTGNDYAAAIAAMRLTAAGRGPRGRADLVEQAIARLEAASAVHLLLAAPVRRATDAGALVLEACRGVVEARPEASCSGVFVETGEIVVDGELARRVALVAAELVSNAVRHALTGRAGALTVRLDLHDGFLRLIVSDDGAGVRPCSARSGTGFGGGIVSRLVSRAGGSLAVETGPTGTAIEVLMPFPARDMDHDVAF